MVLAFTTVTAVLGSSLSRGLASLFFGLALGLVGIDTQSGQARFTLGIPELLDGIDVIVVVVGLFAVGEALYVASRYRYEPEEITPVKGSLWMSLEDWARSWKAWLRGTALGFPFGTLPVAVPRFRPSPYMVEKRHGTRPEEFGQGAIEGVAGPRRPTMLRPPASWSRCWRSGCRPQRPPRSCSPRSSSSACSRDHCCSPRSRPWSGA